MLKSIHNKFLKEELTTMNDNMVEQYQNIQQELKLYPHLVKLLEDVIQLYEKFIHCTRKNIRASIQLQYIRSRTIYRIVVYMQLLEWYENAEVDILILLAEIVKNLDNNEQTTKLITVANNFLVEFGYPRVII